MDWNFKNLHSALAELNFEDPEEVRFQLHYLANILESQHQRIARLEKLSGNVDTCKHKVFLDDYCSLCDRSGS